MKIDQLPPDYPFGVYTWMKHNLDTTYNVVDIPVWISSKLGLAINEFQMHAALPL